MRLAVALVMLVATSPALADDGKPVVDSQSELILCRGADPGVRPRTSTYAAGWSINSDGFQASVSMPASPSAPNRYGEGLAPGTCAKLGGPPVTGQVCFVITPNTGYSYFHMQRRDGKTMIQGVNVMFTRRSDGTSDSYLLGLDDWFQHSTGYVVLEAHGKPAGSGCAASYEVGRVMPRTVYRPIRYLEHTDIPGSDIKEVAVDKMFASSYMSACIDTCVTEPRCVAVSLLGGRCFLKSAQGASKPRSDTSAAYVDPVSR